MTQTTERTDNAATNETLPVEWLKWSDHHMSLYIEEKHAPSEYKADARFNADLIARGIGATYEDGELILRHGKTTRRFHGSSVERWGKLTDDDRAYCRSLMATSND